MKFATVFANRVRAGERKSRIQIVLKIRLHDEIYPSRDRKKERKREREREIER